MPITGTADYTPRLAHAPHVPSLKVENLELPGVEILQVLQEIDDSNMAELLPPALHPTIPPTVQFIGMRAKGGSLGAFTLAQVRIGCRAAVRPRGLPTLVICDAAEAGKTLAERWGFPVVLGEVQLRKFYDRVTLSASRDGKQILAAELIDPLPISGFDVQYTAGMHLAQVEREGQIVPRLVQVDPDYTILRADRGKPRLTLFDAAAWEAEGVRPVYPITASYTVADITMPTLRYLVDPGKPALQGTETV